ncbi:hypothetical protein NQ318_007921 [Aromia moschata]|uniref:Fatty acid desaturase domain-containing protein n=1 Tax=Aromia moschata TaxID=1265417 RepID=A0AAV8XZZ3_9CUCU|nr:hypothetical protein NQ318_007921 [Aromia moschata]
MAPDSTVSTSKCEVKTEKNGTVKENHKNVPNRKNNNPHYGKYKFIRWEFETPLIWRNIIAIFTLHILAVYVLLTHTDVYYLHPGIVIYVLVRIQPINCIITSNYRIFFLQNSLLDWVRDHRVHHKFTETNADPHNIKRGFFFAHVGWLMMRKHPDVIRMGKALDYSDLFVDPLVVFHQKYFIWLKLLFCFILPTMIPPLLWGESLILTIKAIAIVRYTLSLNFTWLVNSAAHLWGTKPYDKKIDPVQNLTVSVVAMGEGYHNYHHTFPWDYRASEMGSSLNITTLWLNFFEKIGWAYDLKSPSQELVKKVVTTHGDGTHYKWGHEVPYKTSADCKSL